MGLTKLICIEKGPNEASRVSIILHDPKPIKIKQNPHYLKTQLIRACLPTRLHAMTQALYIQVINFSKAPKSIDKSDQLTYLWAVNRIFMLNSEYKCIM